MEKKKWMRDYYSPGWYTAFCIRQQIYSTRTKFQRVDIVDTDVCGRCLFLDGKLQSSELDKDIYHSWLVHPAMIAHPHPKRVLIIGGGEGATLKEVLRHKTVELAVMIDLDEKVVEACKIYLPSWHEGSFNDRRALERYGDGRVFLEDINALWDIIIIDISEPVKDSPAKMLYTREFYELVSARLSDNGIISLQAGSSAFGSCGVMTAVYQTLKRVFSIVAPSEVNIPSFGAPWGFMVGSKTYDPRVLCPSEVNERMFKRTGNLPEHYSGGTHKKQFLLTDTLWGELNLCSICIEDKKPIAIYTR